MKHLPLTALLLAFSATVALAKTGWVEDYDKGLEKAKAEKKFALVDFTGSDWCGWCIKLDKEIFSKKEFMDYAKDKLVLVEVDFPRSNPLPKAKQEKHDALMKEHNVKGFPTVLIFDSEGTKLGQLGYTKGGPTAFIAELEKVTAKAAKK